MEKSKKIGFELKEAYYTMGSLYMKGSIWSKKGEHKNYEMSIDPGELIRWINKIKLVETNKKYWEKEIA